MEYDENNTKLREELEKYKANLVELVDEVIYTENQIKQKDGIIKNLETRINYLMSRNSNKINGNINLKSENVQQIADIEQKQILSTLEKENKELIGQNKTLEEQYRIIHEEKKLLQKKCKKLSKELHVTRGQWIKLKSSKIETEIDNETEDELFESMLSNISELERKAATIEEIKENTGYSIQGSNSPREKLIQEIGLHKEKYQEAIKLLEEKQKENEKLLKLVEMEDQQIQQNSIKEYESSSHHSTIDIEKELIALLSEVKEGHYKRKEITNKTIMLVRDKLESLIATNKSLVDEVNYLNKTIEKMKQETGKDGKMKESLNNTEEALSSFLSESEKTASILEKTLLSFKEKLAEADMNKEEGYINLIKSQQKQISELTNDNIELKQVVSSLQDHIKQFTH